MTSPENRAPEPAATGVVGRLAGRPRLVATLILLLALFTGGTAGVLVDRLVLLPRHFHQMPFGPGPGGPRGVLRERATREHFARELGLSLEQQIRIDSLLDRQLSELRAVRGEVQPRLDSILAQTRRAIDQILTPEQRVKAAALARRGRPPRGGRRREEFGPEPRPGPPPPEPPR